MSNRKHTVMLVDDDAAVRQSLRKVLEGEGYHVISASNGVEAVESFLRKQNQIDLLVVDLSMPRKNGWVTLNQFLEVNPRLPVFVITGLSQQDEMAAAAGVSALVEKPIDVSELLRLIRKQLLRTVEPNLQRTGPRDIPFHHLRAVRHTPHRRGTSLEVAPYDHWGLNE